MIFINCHDTLQTVGYHFWETETVNAINGDVGLSYAFKHLVTLTS